MNSILEKLVNGGPVITDGAWGTQLQARGLAPGAFADEWNLSHPDLVEQVAQAYVDAGSQVLLTNTFRANRPALEAHGLADRMEEINRAGVAISKKAANGKALVFASIGPSGKLLVAGEVTEDQLREAYTEQARALAAAGADALLLETFADLEEIRLAIAAARETGLPVAACLVFDSGTDHDRTMMGTTPEQAAAELKAAGADIIGANCGLGITGYIPICRRLKAATDRPLWIKPNAGLPQIVDGQLVYRTSPDQFAGHAKALREAGATFIGGCCGTNPDFIRALCRVFK